MTEAPAQLAMNVLVGTMTVMRGLRSLPDASISTIMMLSPTTESIIRLNDPSAAEVVQACPRRLQISGNGISCARARGIKVSVSFQSAAAVVPSSRSLIASTVVLGVTAPSVPVIVDFPVASGALVVTRPTTGAGRSIGGADAAPHAAMPAVRAMKSASKRMRRGFLIKAPWRMGALFAHWGSKIQGSK